MADVVAPSKKVTFTINRTPARPADRKTIQRLMRMQRPIQKGLRNLSKIRRRERNVTRQRAGGQWTTRVKMTKLTRVEKGETFTLTITPQIIADIKAVERFLEAKPAKSH
ncbi:MAG: hypothetical protein L0Y44_07805 [Phycisphaerales bacterium]|nr:hypothetical protein [Phycisphaerales bacterium]MCI0630541.1 hypothetical protein [Phycisphaerales bacterium]MCI0676829.1 hypothetical protein [Phycisphaerales bacterium]